MVKMATGIVRRVDSLGRIVIPIEVRRSNGLNAFDLVEIYTNERREIIFMKYEPGCVFCSHTADLGVYTGKNVCKDCLNDISEIAFEGG